ncbi:MAG: 2-C-methyl-D-erythritol 4-phosphate cytidylyltransferase [Candidatus Omnitrophica bacterium]|nr:2-C-methyl-D-erythritol 4-phosphate cytidylyltransferase [Candidatus Omnitrophota bacterium]
MKIAAIIVCAGFGKRLGKPKASILLAGKPLFYYSLKVFLASGKIDEIILVLQKKHFKIAKKFIDSKRVILAEGGQTRKDSVINGLKKIKKEIEYVLIHDGARPFLKKELVLEVIKQLKKYPAVIPGIKVTDTLKQVDRGLVKKTLKRDNIFSIQTPQGFNKELIKNAYKKYRRIKVTDSAKIFAKTGQPIKMVEGDRFNFKLTHKEDLLIAEMIKKYGKI